MGILKIGLTQAATFCVLLLVAAVPAVALELPDIHVLSGDTYPATGEGEVLGTEVGTLETELGEKLTSATFSIREELVELSSSGTITIVLTGIQEPRTKTSCNTAGDAAGTVKFSGEYHIVDTSITPLTVALLISFKELVMECNSGKFKIKVRSPMIMKLAKAISGTDITEYGFVSKCVSKGKAELKEYLNDESKGTKGVLAISFGLGFETACENISKELVMKSSKMVDFLF